MRPGRKSATTKILTILIMLILLQAVLPAGASLIRSTVTAGDPEISGDFIVWHDSGDASEGSDIYLYNISRGTLSVICDEEGDQKNPDISQNLVVWEDNRNGDRDIYLYDIDTGKTIPVCTRKGDQMNPRISGSYVTYTEKITEGTYRICIYDPKTSEETSVEIQAWEARLMPGKDFLVILETKNSGQYLSLYNISAGNIHTFRNVTGVFGYNALPRVSGDRVIWSESDESGGGIPVSTIYTYNISSGTTDTVFKSGDYLVDPDIDGELAVWESVESPFAPEKRYSYDLKVTVHNLKTGENDDIAVTKPLIRGTRALSPKISGDYAVWTDAKEGGILLEKIYTAGNNITAGREDEGKIRIDAAAKI
jgi:beta propeller repeat protein